LSRGPRPHYARMQADDTWKCSCGQEGAGREAREAHKVEKAKPALRRLDNTQAWSVVVISARTKLEKHAVRMLGMRAYHDGRLRPYMQATYDGYGVLAAYLAWTELADAVTAGEFPDDELLLPLRIALSVMGVMEIRLIELEQLWDEDDRRNAREILLDLLPQQG
jgi:hypothetical protein